MISWGDIGGKRKPSRFTPVSPTYTTLHHHYTISGVRKKNDFTTLCYTTLRHILHALYHRGQTNF
jgi:hypothetical protein